MLTRRGRFALALGGGTYLGAWAFGAHVLYAPGVGVLLAVGAALVWTNALARSLTLHRRLDRDRPLEGDDVVVRVELEADGGLVPATAVLNEPVGTLGDQEVVVAREGRFLRAVYRLRRVPRGRYRFTGAQAIVEDPFGLARRVQPLADSAPLLVYPRLARLNVLFAERGLRAHGGGRILLRRPAGFELHSVREYQSGESLRRVHWPSTARRRQLMVKELEDAPRDEIVVVLDAESGHGSGPPANSSFDAQVRAAGSLLWAHARRGRNARLVLTSGMADDAVSVRNYERDWPRALEVLASAEQNGRRPVEALLGDRAGAATHARDLAVVTATLRPALVESLIAGAATRQQVSLVYVDAPSFAGRRRGALGAEAAVLRLQSAGIAVAVLRRGDDLERVLEGAESGVAHG
ncbi:MAG: DUF58 domain-containing protein [Thermoleophilia bacterium]|nr:DUF58 domain-containing protein [Thermoleophilia bacterium]